jgi:hypothetical protein
LGMLVKLKNYPMRNEPEAVVRFQCGTSPEGQIVSNAR